MLRLSGKPVMTIATILLTLSVLLAAVMEVLPPSASTIAAAVMFGAGALGKALFYMTTTGVNVEDVPGESPVPPAGSGE